MSIRLLHSFVEPILGCTSFILTCSCWEVTRLQHLHKSQVERTAVCAPGSECAERQPKSSVLAELIFGGCKMDIYMALSGKREPQNPAQKIIWLVILSQFYFTSLYGTYLHPAIYEMDLVPLNF